MRALAPERVAKKNPTSSQAARSGALFFFSNSRALRLGLGGVVLEGFVEDGAHLPVGLAADLALAASNFALLASQFALLPAKLALLASNFSLLLSGFAFDFAEAALQLSDFRLDFPDLLDGRSGVEGHEFRLQLIELRRDVRDCDFDLLDLLAERFLLLA